MSTSIETRLKVPDPHVVKEYFSKNKGTHKIGLNLADKPVSIAFNSQELTDECKVLFDACLMSNDEAQQIETDIHFFHQSSLNQFSHALREDTFSKADLKSRKDWMGEIDEFLIYYQTPDLLSYWDTKEEKMYSFYGRLSVDGSLSGDNGSATRISDVMSDSYYITVCDHIYLLIAELLGAICFHGALVEVGGKTLLLTGLSGAGKSTTALSLFREGAKLFSDEIVLFHKVDEFIWGEGLPIAPRLVGSSVYQLEDLEKSISDGDLDDKHDVDLSGFSRSLNTEVKNKIDAILFFEPPEGSRPEAHTLTEMDPMAIFDYLNFQLLGYNFPQHGGKRLQYLLDLVSSADTYRFTPGTSLATIYPYLQENL